MPRTPNRREPVPADPGPELLSPTAKWVGWGVYAFLALLGFCFGVWAGNQRPRPVEVVKVTTPEPNPVPKAAEPKAPEPKPAEPKEQPKPPTPAAKTEPEPKPAEEPKPDDPKPSAEAKKPDEPKTPDPKPAEAKKPEPKESVPAVTFAKDVQPIFKAKCNSCHGDAKGLKGGLDLRTLATIQKGGDSGDALVPGKPEKSQIWIVIEDGTMPPPGSGKEPVTPAEAMLVRNWILGGGK